MFPRLANWRWVGGHRGGAAGRRFDDDTCVPGEGDLLAARDPAAVERTRGAPVADACGGVGRASGQADDGADEAQACCSAEAVATGLSGGASAAAVLIERASSHQRENKRDADLVLGLRFGLAFGVEGYVLRGVSAGETRLDGLGFVVRQGELAEVEAENSGAAETAAGLARVTSPMSVAPWGIAMVWSEL